MSNRPLALPDSLTWPPQESEYDALYTALAASERGRWFLAEFARRHRHADTPMLVGAISRVAPAVGGNHVPPGPPGAARDLAGVAAVLARIETEIKDAAAATPAASGALERIQDIAFVLHERAVEATLCDNLDAAIREISDIFSHADLAADRMRNAAERLRALASRVGEMNAQPSAVRGGVVLAAQNAAAGPNAAAPETGEDASAFEEKFNHTLASPAASDLLAALRALSEAELIALFS